jgi:hypothetical protein
VATQFSALESKADRRKRGQASPDDGDALALTFGQPVAPAEVEEEDEEEGFGGYGGHSNSGFLPLNTSEFGHFAATILQWRCRVGTAFPCFCPFTLWNHARCDSRFTESLKEYRS